MYVDCKKQDSAMKELHTYSFFGLKDEFEQPKQRWFAYQQLQHRQEQEDSNQETGLEEHQWPQVRIKGDPKPGGKGGGFKERRGMYTYIMVKLIFIYCNYLLSSHSDEAVL